MYCIKMKERIESFVEDSEIMVAVDSFSDNCFLTVQHQETDTGQKEGWNGTRGEGKFIIFLQQITSDLICFLQF